MQASVLPSRFLHASALLSLGVQHLCRRAQR